MKSLFTTLLLLICGAAGYAQGVKYFEKVGIGVQSPNFLLDMALEESNAGSNGIQMTADGKWVRFLTPNLTGGAFNNLTVTGDAGIFFGKSTPINTGDFGFMIAPHRSDRSGLRISPVGDVIAGSKIGIGPRTPKFLLDISTSAGSADGVQVINNTSGRWVRLYSPSLTGGAFNNITATGDAGIIFGNDAGVNTVDYDFVIAPHSSKGVGGLKVNANGDVVIGVTKADARLTVGGTIHAKEVRVDLEEALSVPDYVFEKDYSLMPLNDVAAYVNEHKHLPEVPSAKELVETGLNLKEMNMILLKKIEELTLHLIDQQEEIKKQNAVIEAQGKAIEALQGRGK